MEEENKKAGFSNRLGFILATAASAVGLGNIWRFPYLAARDGGGLFLLIYLLVSLTFGFSFLVTELALGRRTQKHSLKLFGSIRPKWNFLGKLTFIVPFFIMTYYPLIGGWVLKYCFDFLRGNGYATSTNNFFSNFLNSPGELTFWMLAYLFLTAVIVYFGVEKGIEKFSKIIMPGLVLIIIGIAIYSLGLKYTDLNGETRTAIHGLKMYLLPNFNGMTFSKFLEITLDAVCQAFYSLGLSMGIMLTYGVYAKKDTNMESAIKQIDLFDVLISFLAGFIIVPAVYIFLGADAMSAGPGLLFISLPKIFNTMGLTGQIVGAIFFVMVVFAALTSSISVLEAVVASCMELFNISRKKSCLSNIIIIAFLSIFVCLGFNIFYFEFKLPNGQVGQLLDIVDYVCGNFLMPLVAFLTCVFVGWVVKPSFVIEEMEIDNHEFKRKNIYAFMIKYIAPVIMLILFIESTGLLNLACDLISNLLKQVT